jgi:mannose-6-phosphate isomerase
LRKKGIAVASAEKLPPNQFNHFYKGGYRIGALRNGPGGPMRPEEWIGSTTTRFGEKGIGLSTLTNGELLLDALMREPENWLGAEHLNTFGASTEILVKLLDPDQRLPVHYHPNRAFAQKHLSLKHGKTEAWIILKAPEDGYVGLGFNVKKTKAQVAKMVDTRDASGLLASLQKFHVKAGDAVLVPAGVPHAIGEGIFLLELQEPSDMSALLEWNDFAVDGFVVGHLGLGFDTVLDALRYDRIEQSEAESLIGSDRIFGSQDLSIFTHSASPYFRADFLTGRESKVDAGFAILLLLEGGGTIVFENDSTLDVVRGEAIVVPFSSGAWILHGAQGILCRPPLPKFASLAV